MSTLIEQVARAPLSEAAMTQAMEALMTGAMPPEEIRDWLKALAQRGETAQELAAAVRVMRRHATPLPLSQPLELCDTCGTGGDQQHTCNVSTLAALTAAACGVRIAKHGNRAASSRCGSADVLAALGLNLEAPPVRVARSIETLGFGFCFAPLFHPAMKAVAPIRKALNIRTIFNLIGPLANPAPLTFQLVGVSEQRFLEPMAEALQALGIRHGMVVRGVDGLDEVTTTDETEVVELRAGQLTRYCLRPEACGITRTSLEALRGGEAQQNAAIARAVLRGEPSAYRAIVAFNAGCAVYVADQARSIQDGVAKADEALASGRALALLKQVVTLSNEQ